MAIITSVYGLYALLQHRGSGDGEVAGGEELFWSCCCEKGGRHCSLREVSVALSEPWHWVARAEKKHRPEQPHLAIATSTALHVHLIYVYMPRLHPRLFRQARAIDPLLPKLLPVCRDIRSAQNELRWLAEHANDRLKTDANTSEHELLSHYVRRRARGEPLQYIFGSEFFGKLEVKCRPGVLIPRWA